MVIIVNEENDKRIGWDFASDTSIEKLSNMAQRVYYSAFFQPRGAILEMKGGLNIGNVPLSRFDGRLFF